MPPPSSTDRPGEPKRRERIPTHQPGAAPRRFGPEKLTELERAQPEAPQFRVPGKPHRTPLFLAGANLGWLPAQAIERGCQILAPTGYSYAPLKAQRCIRNKSRQRSGSLSGVKKRFGRLSNLSGLRLLCRPAGIDSASPVSQAGSRGKAAAPESERRSKLQAVATRGTGGSADPSTDDRGRLRI